MNFHSNFTDLSVDQRKLREDKRKIMLLKKEHEAEEKLKFEEFQKRIRRESQKLDIHQIKGLKKPYKQAYVEQTMKEQDQALEIVEEAEEVIED